MSDADPILAAVEQALREQITAWWQTPPRLDLAADVAVTAHRRAVLDQRDDGDLERIRGWVGAGHAGPAATTTTYLLGALADETIARRQAEADRGVLVRLREQAERDRDDRRAERDGLAREMYRVEQILGRALGYPPYPADWGAPEGDVCIGEHVPESLAAQAAGAIAAVREKAAALLDGGARAPLPGLRAWSGTGDPGHPRRAGWMIPLSSVGNSASMGDMTETENTTGQDRITAYQIINVGKLQDLTGLIWSDLIDNAPENIEDLTADEARTVLTGLALGAGILPSPAPPSSSRSAKTGQSGRCGSCGTALDHLAAGGYCHDCQ